MNKTFNAEVSLTGVQDASVKPSRSGKGSFQMLAQVTAKVSLHTGEAIIDEVRGFFGRSINNKGKEELVTNFDARTTSTDGLNTYNNLTLSEEIAGLLRVEVLKAFSRSEIKRPARVTEAAAAAGVTEQEVLDYSALCIAEAAKLAGTDSVKDASTTSTKKLEDETSTGGAENI